MEDPDVDILKVLAKHTNNWVVQLPGRKHPAIVLQGDSLKILYDLADEMCQLSAGKGEVHDVAEELRDNLRGSLQLYEQVLRDHELGLPYSRPVTGSA